MRKAAGASHTRPAEDQDMYDSDDYVSSVDTVASEMLLSCWHACAALPTAVRLATTSGLVIACFCGFNLLLFEHFVDPKLSHISGVTYLTPR